MKALLHTEFTVLLARAGLSQAEFARLSGVTARQVNNWARGRSTVPQWAGLLALMLEDISPDLLAIMAEATDFSWHEVLGVPADAGAAAIRQAWTGLALLYHPDKGGRPEQMAGVNAAYERAQLALSGGHTPRN